MIITKVLKVINESDYKPGDYVYTISEVTKDDEILFMAVDKKFIVTEVGYFIGGEKVPTKELEAGEVGYIAASVKNAKDVQVGDTITLTKNRAEKALPGYKEAKSMVYCRNIPNGWKRL